MVTIFPDYLGPLELSLIGQARRKGLIDLRVHDLRDHTHDRHRTVDDTPYGGGAGMVMKPEPWGEALDALLSGGESVPTLIVPSPGGEPFTQQVAAELAGLDWLAFGCGRYEGIDERVYLDAAERMPVRLLSLGDYVLNGGEVAALAMIEAVARLIPGVVGNPASLTEESHQDGLLEYPVYTKPPVWRGHGVPEVLLGGHHGQVEAWRHQQRLDRTAARRPDLLSPSAAMTADDGELRPAVAADAGELFTLTRACWLSEVLVNPDIDIPAVSETFAEQQAALASWQTWVLRRDHRLVGSVRGRPTGDGVWEIGRLMVAPDLQGRGLGRRLLEHAEAIAPADTRLFELVTGAGSATNLRRYRRAGYRVAGELEPGVVRLTKSRRSG